MDYLVIVKGKVGFLYVIKDYYDVDLDLVIDVFGRMKEFENLVSCIYRVGLKVIIDFVLNYVVC